jgi:hypothetical protein
MGTLVFILVVGLIIAIGVLASVRLHVPGTLGTGRFRRIRRLRTLRAVPGTVGSLSAGTVIEEIIDEEEPEEQEA